MALHAVPAGDPVPVRDSLGEAVAAAVAEVVTSASVELRHVPSTAAGAAPGAAHAVPAPTATAPGPPGWRTGVVVRLDERVAGIVSSGGGRSSLGELLDVLPVAAAATISAFRGYDPTGTVPVTPALRRALRDTVAAEALTRYLSARLGCDPRPDLVAETIEYLVEISGTRVESHELTHGVVVADVVHDTPRLELAYPADIRAAKRAPLLFDGQRSLLVVDPHGRARTELQRHRFDRLVPGVGPLQPTDDDALDSGWLVAEATRVLGGLGFFVRGDRSVWTFVDGRPLLVRRSEHWTAFPLELQTSIEQMIGGGAAAALVAKAAFMISAQPRGAILAVVADAGPLEAVVPTKDRYDLRHEIDRDAMRPETRLHHLIDAEELDEHTLVRLATLDGATILDRDGRLLTYGAIVTTSDSEHEGARTAAARTLSETADVVLKVSVDGDITVFRGGTALTTLLGRGRETAI